MTELSCSYGDDRDEVIVAFLYDDPDASLAERSRFETHLLTCARCQADVAALRGVRAQLARWSPPEPTFATGNPQFNPQSATHHPQWWRVIPVWAQVAAALLVLGVSAGIANLNIHYDQSGLTVRTGWSSRAEAPSQAGKPGVSGSAEVARGSGSVADAPWRADIAALERQLKNEIHATQASTTGAPQAAKTVAASASDADVVRRVRALVEESEKRQQRELALRVAELARDVTAQRQADLVRIDRTLGVVQNNLGVEVMKDRQRLNLLYRASQRQ